MDKQSNKADKPDIDQVKSTFSERINNLLKDYLIDIVLVLMLVVYIVKSVATIAYTHKDVIEILADSALILVFMVSIKSLMTRKGILMGQKNNRYTAVIDKFGAQMEDINPYLQYLNDFCDDYNKAEHKRELMTLLSRYTISYDLYQQGIDNPTPLQQEGLSKASKLKLFSLKPSDLTYTGNIESTKDKGIGKTLNQFLKSKSIVDTAITLLSIVIFASFTLKLVSDFSWGNMIWSVLQVIVFLIKGSMSFVSAYMFITEDHANRIIRQTNLLREFENTVDRYIEQSTTNIKENYNVQEK